MIDRDRLMKNCQTCLHNNVCKFTDEEFCKGTKVKDLITECKDYIANGVTVNEWRPASKPPKENGSYLVLQKGGYGHIWHNVCRFATNLEEVDNIDFHFLATKRAGWYDYDSEWGYYEIDTVTHWMPLPQPPKGGDDVFQF